MLKFWNFYCRFFLAHAIFIKKTRCSHIEKLNDKKVVVNKNVFVVVVVSVAGNISRI